MSARTLVKCDGPACTKEIDSTVHAGTWLTLMYGQVFGKDVGDQYKLKADKHFCSPMCLYHYITPT